MGNLLGDLFDNFNPSQQIIYESTPRFLLFIRAKIIPTITNKIPTPKNAKKTFLSLSKLDAPRKKNTAPIANRTAYQLLRENFL